METQKEIKPHPVVIETLDKLGKEIAADVFERLIKFSVADGSASLNTQSAYTQGLSLFFYWCRGKLIHPEQATSDHLKMYREAIARSYKRSTVKLRLVPIRILYQALQSWGVRPDNPMEGIRAPKEATAAHTRIMAKALMPHEAMEFMRVLPNTDSFSGARDKAIALMMILQGLRVAEVSNLTYEQLEAGGYEFLSFQGKGGKARHVRLCMETSNALRIWVERRGTAPGPLFIRGSAGIYNLKYDRLSVRTMERIVNHLLNRAALKTPGRSAHSLRHTYAVMATLGGAKREALADSMGHSSISTTDIYSRAASFWQENPAQLAALAIEKGGSHERSEVAGQRR